MRTGTANTYDKALEQLFRRQTDLASQQEKLSSGQRVNRPSDDPLAAAQAERATQRIARIETEQRALELKRSALAIAESTLGDATRLVQGIRDHVVAAGNAGYSAADRRTLATQMGSLREQLLALANRGDSTGTPLFSGLGSPATPFADGAFGVQFQGNPGQTSATTTALPGAMDGQAVWMNVPEGNGVFKVSLGGGNAGSVWTEPGSVVTPGAVTGDNYSVVFSVAGPVTTYDVIDTTTATTVTSGQPYRDGAPIQFDGLSVVVHGTPANGDALALAPSTQTDLFKILDDAIASIGKAPAGNQIAQTVALSLVQIDAGLERLQSARSQAGDWLNRADSISDAQDARTLVLQSDRSRAVDLDLAKGISDFNKFQTGYQAALQSYAQIQRLTLFNFIN